MDQGEEKAFPWLFPTGIFGFSHKREQKLSLSMYLKIDCIITGVISEKT